MKWRSPIGVEDVVFVLIIVSGREDDSWNQTSETECDFSSAKYNENTKKTIVYAEIYAMQIDYTPDLY